MICSIVPTIIGPVSGTTRDSNVSHSPSDSLLVLASQSWLNDCSSVVSAGLSVCVGGQVSLPSGCIYCMLSIASSC